MEREDVEKEEEEGQERRGWILCFKRHTSRETALLMLSFINPRREGARCVQYRFGFSQGMVSRRLQSSFQSGRFNKRELTEDGPPPRYTLWSEK